MKNTYGYAIVTSRGNLALFEAQCPIYRNKKVAKDTCEYWNQGVKKYKVERIIISPTK